MKRGSTRNPAFLQMAPRPLQNNGYPGKEILMMLPNLIQLLALLAIALLARTKLKYPVQVLLVCALIGVLVAPFVRNVIVANAVIKNPQVTRGFVMSKRPGLTGKLVRLVYSVDNRSCAFWTYTFEIVGSPAYDQIKLFEYFPVDYSPKYPCEGVPGDPRRSLALAERRLIIALPVLVLLAGAIWVWSRIRS
jgi:hypothetical protein